MSTLPLCIRLHFRPLRSAFAALIAGLVAVAGSTGAQGLDPDASVGLPSASYFLVTGIDPRLCPSPVCGGVFVKLVNRKLTPCADGTLAEQCYAPILDWSALGLEQEEEWQLESDFRNRRVLARGELSLVHTPYGALPSLVVSDAWRGVTGNEARGRFLGLVPIGIVCITHPCPELLSIHLNRHYRQLIHGVDLTHSGASEAQIAEGLRSLFEGPGLLVAGKLREIRGPAGIGHEVVAREFYTKVASGPGGGICSGLAFPPNPTCGPGEFCEPPAGSCGFPDLPGRCTPIPEVCPLVIEPVCGCDGITYGNDCERQRAQVGLKHGGPCTAP